MLAINAPRQYVRQENIIAKTGEYVKAYNGKVLIVTGKTAFTQVQPSLVASLIANEIDYDIFYFSGYTTKKIIAEIIEYAQKLHISAIIGVGGGSVLDTAKVAAENLSVPIITIPTVAATCAAWTALSVIYSEHGETLEAIPLKHSPETILVDPKILVQAPVRYLQAGIADTLVKWYEFAPYLDDNQYEFAFATSIHNAKLAIQILEEHSIQAVTDNKQQQITTPFLQVIDAILALAGLVGSIQGGAYKEQLAHSIHNKLTAFRETHDVLHGEKVIFGLVVQFILEGKDEAEIEQFIRYLISLEQPVTFAQLGFTENIDAPIQRLTQLLLDSPKTTVFPATFTAASVTAALYKANELGERITETSLV